MEGGAFFTVGLVDWALEATAWANSTGVDSESWVGLTMGGDAKDMLIFGREGGSKEDIR